MDSVEVFEDTPDFYVQPILLIQLTRNGTKDYEKKNMFFICVLLHIKDADGIMVRPVVQIF